MGRILSISGSHLLMCSECGGEFPWAEPMLDHLQTSLFKGMREIPELEHDLEMETYCELSVGLIINIF